MDSELDIDDELTLPDDTIKILEEFLKEKAQIERAGDFEEDWQLSQFWWVQKEFQKIKINFNSLITGITKVQKEFLQIWFLLFLMSIKRSTKYMAGALWRIISAVVCSHARPYTVVSRMCVQKVVRIRKISNILLKIHENP